jgi:Cys-rich repeat protein
VCVQGACQPCASSAQCATGRVCIAGKCSACTSANQCTAGQGCVNGLCGACQNNTHCAGGQSCNTQTGQCGACQNNAQCTAPQTCGGGGVAGVCGCTPVTCEARGFNCGTMDNGCGQIVACGVCAAPLTCGGGNDNNVCGRNYDWALWPVPDSPFIAHTDGSTRQYSSCPNNGQYPGQDCNYVIQPQTWTFPNPADGTVIDDVTGLQWQLDAAPPSGCCNWTEARALCDNLVLGGFSDWRLPSRVELSSILDFNRASAPYVNTAIFPAASASQWFYTSTREQNNATSYWLVNFTNGDDFPHYGNDYGARCVRTHTVK